MTFAFLLFIFNQYPVNPDTVRGNKKQMSCVTETKSKI